MNRLTPPHPIHGPRRGPLAAAVLAGAALVAGSSWLGAPGADAQIPAAQGLILTDSDADTQAAAQSLSAILTAKSVTPTVLQLGSGDDIGDLSPYACVWDLRYRSDISSLDASRMSTYAQGGGSLFLTGENGGFATRNNSVAVLIDALGGGPVSISNALPTGSGPTDILEAIDPLHPVASQCEAFKLVDYDGVANGQFLNFGTGKPLTSGPGGRGAAVWDPSTLLGAPSARAVAVLDINWLLDDTHANGTLDHWINPRTQASENRAFAQNLTTYLCGLQCCVPRLPGQPRPPRSAGSPCSAVSSAR